MWGGLVNTRLIQIDSAVSTERVTQLLVQKRRGWTRSPFRHNQKHANDPVGTLARGRGAAFLDTGLRGVSWGIYIISVLCVVC